ncbi:MAG: hypothetical protein QMC95_17130 [Desulfitobacteriaceae bacterium]|nr:hypothetical protein [Desulfitobacteriaceae bacterium]MDI6915911.1 hypothetical protein [Desulfitobacteriaceae bacterium]
MVYWDYLRVSIAEEQRRIEVLEQEDTLLGIEDDEWCPIRGTLRHHADDSTISTQAVNEADATYRDKEAKVKQL